MNPVLLKPQSDVGAQVIVQGKVFGEARARDYWTRAAAADPKGVSGMAAKRALGLLPVPLTVSATATPAKPVPSKVEGTEQ